MLAGPPLRGVPFVHVARHVVDMLLLASGFWLARFVAQYSDPGGSVREVARMARFSI